jgi:hypothetical protein
MLFPDEPEPVAPIEPVFGSPSVVTELVLTFDPVGASKSGMRGRGRILLLADDSTVLADDEACRLFCG